MEILSYPIGLLVGLFPVAVDLGPGGEPAHLLLDGRPACIVTARVPACTVDLGQGPRLHRLELVRTDNNGRIVERVERWVNRPGIQSEVRVQGNCDEKRRECAFTMTWAHPVKLDPKKVSLALDGRVVSTAVSHTVRVPFPKGAPPQVLTADAVFADGARAAFTTVLLGSYPETAEARLRAVALSVSGSSPDDASIAASLKAAGWPLRTAEQGEAEAIFVAQTAQLERIPSLYRQAVADPISYAGRLQALAAILVIVPNESLTAFDALSSRRGPAGWLRTLMGANSGVGTVRRYRTADAVAVAGYKLGSSSRRRVLVLVLGSEVDDSSAFSPAQVQAYLKDVMVPLVVWRIGNAAAPEWPAGPRMEKPSEVAAAIAAVRRDLDQQRVAWVEQDFDPRSWSPRLPAGISIAGREEASTP